MKLRIVNILLLLCSIATLRAQSPLDTLAMRAIMVNQLFPQERVYLHFDNSAYYLGETMWFKAYVTCGLSDEEKPQSRVLYVELCAPEGYVVETKKYKLDENGRCNGEFELRKELLSGYYEVRAYTRYMLNWGDEAVFCRVFPVYDKVNGDNYDFKNMLDRKRSFMREGKWVTEELPPAELKFYPEGGHIVEGIETTVAYELLEEEGKPGTDTVFIFADKELLLKSAPTHAGMGTFTLTPKGDVEYSAEVKRGKRKHKFDLPKIEPRGVVVNLAQTSETIAVTVKNNIDFSTPLGIAVLNRGFLIDYQSFGADEKEKRFAFATDSLPEGVNRVVIFANSNIPLAERQFFVRHKNILPGDRQTVKLTAKVNGLAPSEILLQPHEKITLTVEREDGKPIAEDAEFSVSVSDAATRQTMSYTHNMYTHMLLGSEIKGYIPDAAQYFADNSDATRKNLDLLMLTRGWTSYDWSKLTTKQITLKHQKETGIGIQGKFYKQTKNKKFGELDQYFLTPQRNTNIKFDISYDDSIVHKYQFASDEDGAFKIETDEFTGTKGALLIPDLDLNQQMDSTYVFSINKFFSPGFGQYNYWQRNIGLPIKDEKHDTAIVKISDYEFMLTEVDVTGKKKKDRYERPPLSEIRFNFLDEWEFAKEKIIENSLVGKRENEDTEVADVLETMQMNGELTKNDSLIIEKTLVINKDVARKVLASDVLHSIFHRYKFGWCYSIWMIVAKGEYHSDSIVRADEEYLKGVFPAKMMNFKEVVIRSDIGTRQQFKNYGSVLAKKQRALELKRKNSVFYEGFLSDMWIISRIPEDFPKNFGKIRNNTLAYNYAQDALMGGSGQLNPLHPNYVACFIPYKENEQQKGIVPELHTGTSQRESLSEAYMGTIRRYTTVKGYNESKQFYSPNYKDKRPSDKNDVRRTLIWEPSVKANGGKLSIELYNSAITKTPIIDVEGIGGSTFYGTTPNISNRPLSDNQSVIEKRYGKNFVNNPAIIAYTYKITTEGRGLYREKEYERAFEKFHEAAALGYPDAMLYAGICYTNGEGVEQDSVKAFRMFRSAANGKNIVAMHNLANCYMQGIGTTANNILAHKWYTAAADSGYTRSMSMLAKSYEEGLFTEKDSEKANEWYKKAAEKEEPYAMYKVARMYEHEDSVASKKGKALRESEAIKLFTRAAELHNVQAQMKLAECYSNGRYVKKNKKLRFEWLLHAANNGLMEAQELVAECFEKGRGAEHNDGKAYKYYKLAGEQGSKLGKIKAKEYELFKFYK
ncbi:MAG: SEL1-like repeat protein [Bacteroidaceae bacterium]|nr:SEL1-like repeat protein [Bacteroidaceae bacterium]